MKPDTIPTVIADDHFLVRSGLKVMLSRVPGVEVLYEASDGAELTAAAIRLRPRLVVTDISMNGMDGLEALSDIRAALPECRLLVISMHDEPYIVRRAVENGAHGYLLKGGPPMELQQAVHTLLSGGSYFSAEVTQRLLSAPEPSAKAVLTRRQIEILKRMASGQSSKQIAFDLGLSSKTVDAHRARIMERLQIRDVAGLTRYAIRHGFVDVAGPADQ